MLEVEVTKRTKLGPCPQHAAGKCAALKYLLRTCPSCMAYLSKHPEAASLAKFGVPGRCVPRTAARAFPVPF